jgi:hypothetical protein
MDYYNQQQVFFEVITTGRNFFQKPGRRPGIKKNAPRMAPESTRSC